MLMARKAIFCILWFLASFSLCSALVCNVCDGVDSLERCRGVEVCDEFAFDRDSSEICQNDYRVVNNKVTMRKKCKPRKACLTEEKMSDNNCDENTGRNTVCRCCCETDKCNSQKKGCFIPSDCKKPIKPTNGNVRCPSRTSAGTRCLIGCNKGFKLEGIRSVQCGKDRESGVLVWKPRHISFCVKDVVKCRPPHRKPKFGRMACRNSKEFKGEVERNFAGSSCSFECMEGFVLKGEKISQCQKNKKWKSRTPICVRAACAKIPAHDFRTQNCTDRNLVGSVCDFECEIGYGIVGAAMITCELNETINTGGKWSASAPKCEANTCGALDAPANGNVRCSAGSFARSQCSFSCNDGFDLDDTPAKTVEMECAPSDDNVWEWSGLRPSCSPIRCERREPPHGHFDCTNGEFKDSVCGFSCDEGYYLVTAVGVFAQSVCIDDGDGDSVGVWTGSNPSCKPVACDPIDTVAPNRILNCTNGNFASSVCKLACNAGYHIEGASKNVVEIQCLERGEGSGKGIWSGDVPMCSLLTCNEEHVDPVNGSVKCTNSNVIGSTCTFTCDLGYDMDDTKNINKSITCKENGNGRADWDASAPTCSAITCGREQTRPINGAMSCTNANFANSVCTVTCDEGFNIGRKKKRKVNVTCLVSDDGDGIGEWSGVAPTCSAVTCDPFLENPIHGSVSCSNENFEDSVCSFSCDEGYNLDIKKDRTAEVRCVNVGTDVGKWSALPPTCSQIECNPVGEKIPDGSARCTKGNAYGSVCTFTCDEGFGIDQQISGDTVIECLANGREAKGEWSAAVPTCSPISCNPSQSDPLNGSVKCNKGNFLNSVCRFKCDAGHVLSGIKRKIVAVKCLDDGDGNSVGEWDDSAPTCSPVTCPPREIDAFNGLVSCTDGTFKDSVCTFSCSKGSGVPGTTDEKTSIKCFAGDRGETVGKWSGSAPACSKISCESTPVPPENGAVTCTNGAQQNSICVHTCDSGYRMDNSTQATLEVRCINNGGTKGKWTASTPTCSVITCYQFEVPENGTVACTKQNALNSVCTFRCNNGFHLDTEKGEKTRLTCVVNKNHGGEWDGPIPRCSKRSLICEIAPIPPKGKVTCTDGNFLGSTCTYSCKTGYDLVGTDGDSLNSVCEVVQGIPAAKWSAGPVTCIPIRCKPPHKHPDNGRVICTNSNFVGSSCVFLCNVHYDMGNTTAASWTSDCMDDGDGDAEAQWSHPPGVCNLRRCYPIHSNPKNGSVSCSKQNSVKSVCTFTCDVGYQLIGPTRSSCVDRLKDGDEIAEWNREPPTCEKGVCENPLFDYSSVSLDCGDANGPGMKIVGTECAYACKYSGYYLTLTGTQHKHIRDGKLVATCLSNGAWNADPPGCSPVSCHPALTAPIFGYPPQCKNTNKFRSVCNFSCMEGFSLTHRYPLTCRSYGNNAKYGRWDNAIPTCVRLLCPVLRSLSHGTIEYPDGNRLGSVAHLVCSEGYTANFFLNTTCVESTGRRQIPYWSNDKYLCCVKCQRNSDLKFVAVIDKTAARDNSEWRELIQFLEVALTEMRSNGFRVNFGLVLYDQEVDVSHSLPLTSADEFENLNVIIKEMKGMPYGGDDSNTGQALVYANEVMFPTDTKEEPYLMLAMGGKSNDEVKEAAKKIREKDINVLALSINSGENRQLVDISYMMAITGKEENIFTIGSSGDLGKVRERITQIAMQNGCGVQSKSQPCT